jgi:hypothetical protein
VVDFLKSPDKYTALGAKIPKVRGSVCVNIYLKLLDGLRPSSLQFATAILLTNLVFLPCFDYLLAYTPTLLFL